MKQKFIYFLVFFTIPFSSFLRCVEPTQQEILAKQNAILHILNASENAVWSSIASRTGITYEQCKQIQQEHFQKKETYKKFNDQVKKGPPLSSYTQQLIVDVFAHFGVNSDKIEIISRIGDVAEANDWTLCVDEQQLLSCPQEVQYFSIGHELMHIYFKDHSMILALNHLLIGKEKKDAQIVLEQLLKFNEIRADIIIMLKHNIYAQGGIKLFEKLQECDGKSSGPPTHPESAERLAWAQAISLLIHKQ